MPIEILMPALSPTMEEGNLAKWVKKEGDKVEPGDVIAEIETDKATMEVEAVEEGILGKILVKEGTKSVKVNAAIALLLSEGEDKKALDDYKPAKAEKKVVASAEEQPEIAQQKEEAAEGKSSKNRGGAGFTEPPKAPAIPKGNKPLTASEYKDAQGGRIKISPLAKVTAKSAGIDVSNIIGSGPHGRIIKADVEKAVQSGGKSFHIRRNPNEITAVENDNMRKVIASRLLQSKQHVPHFYLTIDCNIDKLLELRQDLNETAPVTDGKPAYKISVNDMIIKAVAGALKKVPQSNASWSDEAILLYNNVDVSVAVAIDSGLITPIVKNADQKSLPAISNEMKSLAARARQGKLAPSEFQGGGFSISNLGMFGIKNFSAIVNPPQACILAVGAGQQVPIVKNGAIVVANMVSFTLSCDHRVVDGAVGAQFLAAFKEYIEKPVTMII